MITIYLSEFTCFKKPYTIAYRSAVSRVINPRFPFDVVNVEIIRDEFRKLTNAELILVEPTRKRAMPESYNSIRFKTEADMTMFILKWS